MKRLLKVAAFRLILVLLTFTLGLGTVEVMAVAYLTIRDGEFIPASIRYQNSSNVFIEQITRTGSSCRYVDTLFPHPYLGFVHHANPPCGMTSINSSGLFGPDFPLERSGDRFVVMITGGSVAAQFGQINPNGPRFLEEALNTRYESPNGSPFLVLNGADGAWKQPQQTVQFLLYGDAIDAVITLDGFNEHYSLTSSFRIEYPANNFALANPVAKTGYEGFVVRWLAGKVYGLSSRWPVLADSQAAYLVASAVYAWANADAAATDTPRRTSVESLFALPRDWSAEKKSYWNMEKYRNYVRDIAVLAKRRGVLAAYFIQPVPAIGKPLSTEERTVAGDLGYADIYRRMVEGLLDLKSEGLSVYSLLDIFSGMEEPLYADPIHLRRDTSGDSKGYRLMANAVAERLADAWNLVPKPQ